MASITMKRKVGQISSMKYYLVRDKIVAFPRSTKASFSYITHLPSIQIHDEHGRPEENRKNPMSPRSFW